MAFRISAFFFTVILGSVLVSGQPPMDPAAVQPVDPAVPCPPPPPGVPPPPPGVTPPPPGVTPPPPGVTPPPPGVTPPPPGVTPPPPGVTPPAGGLPPVQADPSCAPLATKCLDDIPFLTGESIYWVGKIYVGAAGAAGSTPGATPAAATTPTTPAPAVPGSTAAPCGDNTCSITSYKLDSCQAVKMIISRNEDGSMCVKEAVFNKVTNSVALFKNTWLPADPQKAIIKQLFGYYGTMDQTGTVKIVDPSPPDVKTTQAVDFVLIGASEGGEWVMFSSCCKSVVFVLYSDAIICAKSMKTFDAAITPLVTPLGIQFTDLKDVPTEVTIKLDNFIPVLPPVTPGATPAALPASATPAALPASATPPPAATPPVATPPAVTPPPATPPK